MVELLPILQNNTKFYHEIIRKSIVLPQGITIKQICSARHFFEKSQNILVSHYLDRNLSINYFLSLDLNNVGAKEFEYRLDSKDLNPEGFELHQPRSLLSTFRHRVFSKNLCVMKATFTKTMKPVNVIGKIMKLNSNSTLPADGNADINEEKKPFKPIFLVSVEPNRNKFYRNSCSKKYSELNFISRDKKKLKREPLLYFSYSNQFAGASGNQHKLVSIVIRLKNYDLVLIIFDLNNRKILKKHYIGINEILSTLKLISFLQIRLKPFFGYSLNPFRNTLEFGFSTNRVFFDKYFGSHRRERQRLVDLGFDVSNLAEDDPPNTHMSKKTFFIQIQNCFDASRRVAQIQSSWFVKSRQIVSETSLIRWVVDKNIQISIRELRGTQEICFSFEGQKAGLKSIEFVKELDKTSVLVFDEVNSLLINKKTSEILEKRLSCLCLPRDDALLSYKNMIFIHNGDQFTILKWREQQNSKKEQFQAKTVSLEKILDHRFVFSISPLFGEITKAYDFRYLPFDQNILSIIFNYKHYQNEKKNTYQEHLFHGLFDIRHNRFFLTRLISKRTT